MARVEHEIIIYAPVPAVYQKLLDLENAPEWLVSLDEVHNVTGREEGCSFEWSFKMVGRQFTGVTVLAEVQRNRRLVEESSGGISSTWVWLVDPTPDGGTHVQVSIDYTVPGSVFGAIADKLFIERQNEKDLKISLGNLKLMLEE